MAEVGVFERAGMKRCGELTPELVVLVDTENSSPVYIIP
jgi:hypothetical protein